MEVAFYLAGLDKIVYVIFYWTHNSTEKPFFSFTPMFSYWERRLEWKLNKILSTSIVCQLSA